MIHRHPLHQFAARPQGCAVNSLCCHDAERPWLAVTRPLCTLHVHLLEVGEQEWTQGMGSLGSAVPAVLCSLTNLVTTMVRTSHHCAGGTQERCGLVISGVSTAQALGLAWGCWCC